MPLSADTIRTLHPYEVKILLTLEQLMKRYQWVPLEIIKKVTKFSDSELNFRLRRLIARDMIRYDVVPYEGYSLIFNGYDSMALHALAKKKTISSLGCLIGEGKESRVFEALGLGPVALKFHRVGQRSFHSARVNREYMPGSTHCSWLYASRLSAEREFEALKHLHQSVNVPLPIDNNRHVIVMSFIPGVNLNRCTLEAPKEVFDEVIRNIRAAYQCGVIHADMSEFNIMVSDGEVTLIDWPQWIEPEHPNAIPILENDLGNLITYFKRKYNLSYALEEIVQCVIS